MKQVTLAAAIWLAAAQVASAAVVTVEFSGVTTVIGSGLSSVPFDVGDPVSLTIDLDPADAGTSIRATTTRYTPSSLSFEAGGVSAISTGIRRFDVINDNFGVDSVETDLSFIPAGASLTLSDTTGSVLSDQSLSGVLNEFASNGVSGFDVGTGNVSVSPLSSSIFGGCGVIGSCAILWDVTSVSVSTAPVPVPASLGFLAAGLGGLGALALRRRRMVSSG